MNPTIDRTKVEIPLEAAEYLEQIMDGLCNRLSICKDIAEYRKVVEVWTTLDMAITKAIENRVIEGAK